MDGFALVRALRADAALATLPVILLSARAGEEARLEGLEVGADDYLVKPFSARALLTRISANLKLARLRRDFEARSAADAERIRNSEAQLKSIVALSPLGVYIIDASFRIRDVNPTALPAFGSIADPVGRDFAEVLRTIWPQTYADEVLGIFRRTLETGEPYMTPERGECRRDRGVTEFYEWQVHRVPLQDGYGVVCYFRDISQHVRIRERLRLMVNELNHRVKNTLATIQAIVAQTLRHATSTAAARRDLESRLIALARAHDILTNEHWEGANLVEVVNGAVSAYAIDPAAARFHIEGSQVKLSPKAALALSMALHELATNASKYGALSNEDGRVRINWAIDGEVSKRFRFRWVESGGPIVVKPQRRGFGSRLIEQGLTQDIRGSVELAFPPEGLTCLIDAPIDEISLA
jgi:PAS domain S-box-containing protein